MSSYGSHHSSSAHLHPSHAHQTHPNPPYPTTPQPQPQPTNYYPQNAPVQPGYSTSPASQAGSYFNYSSSPQQQYQQYPAAQQDAATSPFPRDRRSSSTSSTSRPQFPPYQSAPIAIPSQNAGYNSGAGTYSTSNPSYSQHFQPAYSWQHQHQHQGMPGRRASHAQMHEHGWGDGEGEHGRRSSDGNANGGLDEETLRSYERRYAKDRKLERRPTMGDSLMSMVGKLGGVLGGDRR